MNIKLLLSDAAAPTAHGRRLHGEDGETVRRREMPDVSSFDSG
jgi:hypothetical protein